MWIRLLHPSTMVTGNKMVMGIIIEFQISLQSMSSFINHKILPVSLEQTAAKHYIMLLYPEILMMVMEVMMMMMPTPEVIILVVMVVVMMMVTTMMAILLKILVMASQMLTLVLTGAEILLHLEEGMLLLPKMGLMVAI